MTASYEPCDKCSAKWAQGFLLIEASDKPNVEGQPPLNPGAYPTGNYMVFSQEAAIRLFGLTHAERGVAFIDKEAFKKLSESASKAEE